MQLKFTSTAAVLLCSTLVMADGVYRDGLGAISVGRGGTNIAFSDNGQMIMDNPAGMSNVDSTLIGVGVDMLFTDLEYADSDNSRRSGHNNPFPVGQATFITTSEDGRWGLGFGVYSQAGFGAQYDLNGPAPFTGERPYKSLGAMARVLPALSYRVSDRFTVGATLGVAVSHMELEGPYFLQGPNPFAGTPLLLDMQSTGAALSWSVGMQYQLTPRTRIGLNYLGETDFNMNGNTKVDIPGLGSARFDSTLGVTWPRTLGIGLQHQCNEATTLSCDVIWADWSSAFDQMDLQLSSPNDPTVAGVTGTAPFVDQFPLRWRDTISVRLGLERQIADERVVRTGYVYHQNPIPSSTLTPFIQATLEHAVSVGYGWKLGNSWRADVAYQFSFGSPQSTGTSAFVGSDFDNSKVWTSAHWFLIELTHQS